MTVMRNRWLTCCLQGALVMSLAAAVVANPVLPLPPPPEATAAALDPGAPVEPVAEDLLFASPTRLDHIGRVTVMVTVNDRGPFRFIVDTGANYSTVSPRLLTELGLQAKPGSSILVDGITGSAQVPAVSIRKLQAGSLVIDNMRLPIVWAPLMAGADGILGVANLTNEKLLVDFEHNSVQISRPTHTALPRGVTRVVAKRIRGGLMSIPGTVGGVHVLAIIDTGSERTIANSALREALLARSHHGEKSGQSVPVYGATTDVEIGDLDVSPLIDLGPIRIGRVNLVYGHFHIFEVWNIADRPAIVVGMDILGTVSSFTIDFRQAQLLIESKLHFESYPTTVTR